MSVKKAMQTYARQGGTSSIFINDDGMRVSEEKGMLVDRFHLFSFFFSRSSHQTKGTLESPFTLPMALVGSHGLRMGIVPT
jgi:hypothetical protein